MRNIVLCVTAAAAVASLIPVEASAAIELGECATSNISPSALACEGLFKGNVFSNSPADILTQTSALQQLGLDWDGSSTTLGGQGSFDKPFFIPGKKGVADAFLGTTFVGIFFDSKTKGDQFVGSGFYKFDAGTGLPSFFESIGSSSKVVLFSTGVAAVPEPATWGMMIIGFAALGMTARRRQRVVTTVSYL